MSELPDDVWVHILRYLLGSELRHMCQTNKRYYMLGNECLPVYRTSVRALLDACRITPNPRRLEMYMQNYRPDTLTQSEIEKSDKTLHLWCV